MRFKFWKPKPVAPDPLDLIRNAYVRATGELADKEYKQRQRDEIDELIRQWFRDNEHSTTLIGLQLKKRNGVIYIGVNGSYTPQKTYKELVIDFDADCIVIKKAPQSMDYVDFAYTYGEIEWNHVATFSFTKQLKGKSAEEIARIVINAAIASMVG